MSASYAGDRLQQLAQGWLVATLTDATGFQSTAVGALNVLGSLPLLLSPLGGVIADQVDRRRAELNTEAIGSQYGQRLQGVTVEDTEPDITALWCRPDGSLWVRTSRGDRERAPGVLTTIDVFDAAAGDSELHGMGTTLTIAAFEGGRLGFGPASYEALVLCGTRSLEPATAEALKERGIKPDFVPKKYVAEHVVEISRQDGGPLEIVFGFSPTEIVAPLPGFDDVRAASAQHWEQFWENGGTIDFAECTDPRAGELERRAARRQRRRRQPRPTRSRP